MADDGKTSVRVKHARDACIGTVYKGQPCFYGAHPRNFQLLGNGIRAAEPSEVGYNHQQFRARMPQFLRQRREQHLKTNQRAEVPVLQGQGNLFLARGYPPEGDFRKEGKIVFQGDIFSECGKMHFVINADKIPLRRDQRAGIIVFAGPVVIPGRTGEDITPAIHGGTRERFLEYGVFKVTHNQRLRPHHEVHRPGRSQGTCHLRGTLQHLIIVSGIPFHFLGKIRLYHPGLKRGTGIIGILQKEVPPPVHQSQQQRNGHQALNPKFLVGQDQRYQSIDQNNAKG